MIRGTTPTHTFLLPFDTAEIRSLRIAYAQRGEVILQKSEADCTCEGDTLRVQLTQEDTLRFAAGDRMQMQLRVRTANGDVFASRLLCAEVEDCLCEEVLQ